MAAVAIMQPYIFPYLGYFQMVNVVDQFVFLNDVKFIKRGWINRNQIWANGPLRFTIPVIGASQNRNICEHLICDRSEWLPKLLRTIENTYSKAPFFNPVFDLIQNTFQSESNEIDQLAMESVMNVSEYLEISVKFLKSSEMNASKNHGQDRILQILDQLGASSYVNAIGGKTLYESAAFDEVGISLHFLEQLPNLSRRFSMERERMSMIDWLMHHSVDELKSVLDKFKMS